MKYTVYFTWYDNTEDSFNCDNRKECHDNIMDMLKHSSDFKSIKYCKLYANGEHGLDRIVK